MNNKVQEEWVKEFDRLWENNSQIVHDENGNSINAMELGAMQETKQFISQTLSKERLKTLEEVRKLNKKLEDPIELWVRLDGMIRKLKDTQIK